MFRPGVSNYCYTLFPLLLYVKYEVNHVTLSQFFTYIILSQSDVAISYCISCYHVFHPGYCYILETYVFLTGEERVKIEKYNTFRRLPGLFTSLYLHTCGYLDESLKYQCT